jgi:hypothetical protein
MANTREHRYAVSLIWNGNLGTGTSGYRDRGGSVGEPKVRIHLPPGESPQTIGSAGDFTGSRSPRRSSGSARRSRASNSRNSAVLGKISIPRDRKQAKR